MCAKLDRSGNGAFVLAGSERALRLGGAAAVSFITKLQAPCLWRGATWVNAWASTGRQCVHSLCVAVRSWCRLLQDSQLCHDFFSALGLAAAGAKSVGCRLASAHASIHDSAPYQQLAWSRLGGHRFDALCSLEGCMFTICPPANDRWHPWPFMRRMYDAAVRACIGPLGHSAGVVWQLGVASWICGGVRGSAREKRRGRLAWQRSFCKAWGASRHSHHLWCGMCDLVGLTSRSL